MSVLEIYGALRVSDIKVVDCLAYHFKEVLKQIYKKIGQESFRFPLSIVIKREIYYPLFFQFYKTVKDLQTSFGREIIIVNNNKNEIKEIKIIFTKLHTLKLHLKEITNSSQAEVTKYFIRSWTNGNSAKVIISTEKPAIMLFKVRSNTFLLSMSYEFKNRYGTVCI